MSRNGGKKYHGVQDGCPQLSYNLRFYRPDPRGREITKYEDFGPFLAEDGLWHLDKSWARAENGKIQFPGARGPNIEEEKLPRYP